jgi:hypothetical protein
VDYLCDVRLFEITLRSYNNHASICTQLPGRSVEKDFLAVVTPATNQLLMYRLFRWLLALKLGLIVVSACLTDFLEPSMVNSTAVVQYQGGIITTTGTPKMSVTPLTTVLTLPVYCELIASALGFE